MEINFKMERIFWEIFNNFLRGSRVKLEVLIGDKLKLILGMKILILDEKVYQKIFKTIPLKVLAFK